MKIIAKSFVPKRFLPDERGIGRVASSVRLSGVRGTEQQRIQMAEDLNNRLFQLIDDVFEKKIKNNQEPELNGKEILTCLKKIIPNIKVKFEPELRSNAVGAVSKVLNDSKTKVTSFTLRLQNHVKKGVNEQDLRHETRHMFDYITQPKLLARENTDALIGKMTDYTPFRDMEHFDFYEEFLYAPRRYYEDRKELNMLKKGIKAHFNELKSSSEEKIETLQSWRSRLKTETNAYKDETKFIRKKYPEQHSEDYLEYYFLEPKTNVVEQLLKEEIASVRAQNAVKYGN